MKALVRRHLVRIALVVFTIASILAVGFRVRLNPDVVALLPRRGDAGALSRYIKGFGGGGVSVVLVESDDPTKNAELARRIATELAAKPTVAFAAAGAPVPGTGDKALDPWLLYRNADATARRRIAEALEPDAMRARLRETKSLLLAPGSGALGQVFARDPLRLSQIVYEKNGVGAGVKARTDGLFATEDGRAHLVVVKPRGQALRGADARAFSADVEAVLAPLRSASPGVSLDVTGPHAVAAATEELITKDLERSGVLSLVLASLVFAAIYRRLRALFAVIPPLLLGTLWTAALASLWPTGISAIAVAFASVVVGVGFDTGVHVYSALLDARREGHAPAEAVRIARARTARPVLVAATIAGAAFASLALSSIEAVGQLGLLCGAGEILTAIAIVLITPEVGGLLERGTPPPPVPNGWTRFVHALTKTRARAAAAFAVAALVALSWIPLGLHVADSIVAVRPKGLAPLEVERRIFEAFGGRPQPWIVLVGDADRDRAMHRADLVAERLAEDTTDVERVDALTAVLPARATQEERLAERDRVLAGKADALREALRDTGFAVDRFEPALAEMRDPPHEIVDPEAALRGDLAVLGSRYLGEEPGAHLVAMHVHLRLDAPGGEKAARAAMERIAHEVDPEAAITGYARLEADLHASLATDMPKVAMLAGALVVVMLGASLRRVREVAIAVAVLTVGIGALLGVIALLHVPLHIYSALVIPVLLGISVDEAMFLLYHARDVAQGADRTQKTLEEEGPPVLATALTTSAGFAALAFAKYGGLADLGTVGALGSAAGLCVALVIVPAGLRLFGAPPSRG
jgi:predicted RND superfamily exporter protein